MLSSPIPCMPCSLGLSFLFSIAGISLERPMRVSHRLHSLLFQSRFRVVAHGQRMVKRRSTCGLATFLHPGTDLSASLATILVTRWHLVCSPGSNTTNVVGLRLRPWFSSRGRRSLLRLTRVLTSCFGTCFASTSRGGARATHASGAHPRRI